MSEIDRMTFEEVQEGLKRTIYKILKAFEKLDKQKEKEEKKKDGANR